MASSQSLINQISRYQSERVHHKIKMQKTEGTTQWLTREISTWLDHRAEKSSGKSNCLWISGTVGCGKTFLA
ncbi:hypothetical protein AUEXF2481DRAFT_45365 [Aureobasidium subglaciale EXF-2481]|uniref:Nephrocystin 3-like N-terminal domain-containing protein n=1 Tax=Aureobasidium subglaciale (strain EXF-2481) TaxID=1043005 RepID=A0A074Y2N6_AURSE|nr:uncharacterized protein AUEXF2481DRAFT_45365 [Aureobasidium subglaciale EXF-2481]KEQ90169.1 hypothetical protein AUEXF2481DRAFT_45365 [Aureobasidium subglaciale EXF-2481]